MKDPGLHIIAGSRPPPPPTVYSPAQNGAFERIMSAICAFKAATDRGDPPDLAAQYLGDVGKWHRIAVDLMGRDEATDARAIATRFAPTRDEQQK
jgi:hypothetical protein